MPLRPVPRRLGAALVLAGSAVVAHAQTFDPAQRLDWPEGLLPGSSVQRVEVGDPFGDGREHAFVLRGGTLCVAFEPRHFESITQPGGLGSGIVDFVLGEVPGASGAPAKDHVYFTTSVGAFSTRLEEDPWSFMAPTSIATGAWAGAKRLRAYDLDQAHREDLVGLNAAGTHVLVLYAGAAGWSAGASIAAAGTALDVAVGQFDADADAEIAVLSTTHVRIYEQDGTLRYSLPNPNGTGLLTTFRDGADPTRHRAAVALEWPSPGQWILQTLDATGRDLPVPLSAVPPCGEPECVYEVWLQPTGLAAADLLGGSPGLGEDLLVAIANWPAAFVYENQAASLGAQQFDPDEHLEWTLDAAPELWTSGLAKPPGIADGASLLGEQTGVFSVQATLPATDALYVVPDFSDATEGPLSLAFVETLEYVHPAQASDPCRFHFRVNLPEDAIELGFDHLQAIVWAMDPDTETLTSAVANQVLALDEALIDEGELIATQADFVLEIAVSGLDPAEVEWDNGEHFAVNFRWVSVDENTGADPGDPITVLDVSREYFGGFAIRSDDQLEGTETAIADHLEWLYEEFTGGLAELIAEKAEIEDPPGSPPGGLIGAYLGVPRLPDLDLPPPPPEPVSSYYQLEPLSPI
ncbi:MAG TPA: hypothetical protein VJP77_02925 [Planctomycetota bacterium]|nr:hypothetical protein [Planctomycetota bacterium]